MIIITGAAGFIGSCLLSHFNQQGYSNIVAVDDFSREDREKNWKNKQYKHLIDRKNIHQWMIDHATDIRFVFHIGARTDTTEFNKAIFDELNERFSQQIWTFCATHQVPLVYASSAATYGMGEYGYQDDHQVIQKLKPLNPYGESKNNFDKWALNQQQKPPFWAGLKFFNVYGPNEYHKKRMASVVFHAYHQIIENQQISLFRSHNTDYLDGQQLRDFIYVKDILKVCHFLFDKRPQSGIYNLGTGTARTFIDLAKSIFVATQTKETIQFIDIPADIRDKYQYFTQADMSKLHSQGYTSPFYTIEEGVKDYVENYLVKNEYY